MRNLEIPDYPMSFIVELSMKHTLVPDVLIFYEKTITRWKEFWKCAFMWNKESKLHNRVGAAYLLQRIVHFQ